MTSIERLKKLEQKLESTCFKNCGHGWNENCICGNNYSVTLENLRKDLEELEILRRNNGGGK